MDPIDIATYMSWVPLIGSGLGNLLGGIVSDKVIRGEWLGWIASPSKGSISSKGKLRFPPMLVACGFIRKRWRAHEQIRFHR